MDTDGASERARQRDLVRRGYDAISMAYRHDDGGTDLGSDQDEDQYARWVAELAGLVPGGGRVVDLGCGAGIPGTRELTGHGLQVLGIDFSAVQLRRARQLVPGASFARADMAGLELQPASVDAVVAFYSLIHVPVPDQRALFPRIREWLRDGGYFLAIVGKWEWTCTEPWLGTHMFWDHAGTDSYLDWFRAARLTPLWDRFVPEGPAGHTLVLAQAS
jgi:SAM-dependent methyltransferase